MCIIGINKITKEVIMKDKGKVKAAAARSAKPIRGDRLCQI